MKGQRVTRGNDKPLEPGEKAFRFINKLTHTKGPHAREEFNLRPWQERIVRELFGTIRRDGLRQYRTCLLMLPRKNGKSELAAAIALYGLLGDGEIGAEVYSAAADRDQASLVFNVAAEMVRQDPELSRVGSPLYCEIVESQKRIVFRKTGSVYRAISAEAYSKHGFNASLVIYDELHAAPNRDLWDVLATSQGARAQPLMLAITTAGYDRHSILWELYDHACKVRDGIVDDPTFLSYLFEAAKDADWTDEAVWHAANPALGDFRSIEEMRSMAARAMAIPAQENTFRRLYLNQWTEQAERWLPIALWDACQTTRTAGALAKRPLYVGMDLSSTRDLTALVGIFPDGDDEECDVIAEFFVPKESIRERQDRDRVPYEEWARRGHLNVTPGNVVDYEAVRAKLNEWAAIYNVREIAFDNWNATDLVTRLQQDGFTLIKVGQTIPALSAGTKEVEKLVASKKLRHDGHPVLRWCVSNVAIEPDHAGNIKPSKRLSTEKIDGVIALVMAMDRNIRRPIGGSVYDTRGVEVF